MNTSALRHTTPRHGTEFLRRGRTLVAGLALSVAAALPQGAFAAQVENYPFTAAVQELTQLIWLAETAHACGWASTEDTQRFEAFAVRFLAAHMDGTYQRALLALAGDRRYVSRIAQAALDNAEASCGMARWRGGWTAYAAAARDNEGRY